MAVDGYVSDVDGSMRPTALSYLPPSPGVFVTDFERMVHFVDRTKCLNSPDRCSAYCTNACFRSIHYIFPGQSTQGYQLQVCRAGSTADCTIFPTYFKLNDITRINHFRYATAHLPQGKYTTRFLNATGHHVPLSHLRVVHPENVCPGNTTWQLGDIVMDEPTLPDDFCNEIIRNGDLEESSTEPVHWQQFRTSIWLARGKGVGGSNALAAGRSTGELTQPIPIQCSKEGYTYEVTAKVRVVDHQTGQTVVCDHRIERCPVITIRTQRLLHAGRMGLEQDSEGFQTIRGTFTMTGKFERSGNHFTISFANNYRIFVDNVSMRLLSKPVEDVAASFSLDGEVESVTVRDGLFHSSVASK